MNIDLSRDVETYLTIPQAAKLLPGRPHASTVARWCRGLKNGVRLVSHKVGGRRVVALSELERFINAATADADGSRAPDRSSKARNKAIEAAERELAAEGFGERRSPPAYAAPYHGEESRPAGRIWQEGPKNQVGSARCLIAVKTTAAQGSQTGVNREPGQAAARSTEQTNANE